MATTTSTTLSNEVKALYDADFLLQGQSVVYWDQFANLRMVMNGQRGLTYNFPIIESQQPNTTPLDELQDVAPQQMRANEIIVTLQEYGGAIEVTKFSVAVSYADVYQQAAFVNGYNLAESIDFIARAVYGQGTRVIYQNGKTARSGLDGQQTAGSRINSAFVMRAAMIARTIKMPLYEDGAVCTVLHPFVMYDLQQDPTIQTMSQYSKPEMLFNGEVGYWGGVRFIVSAAAKGFWGAGANAAVVLATTLAAPANIGDTNLKLTSVTGLTVGQFISIQDAAETGNTWSDTNELFYITAVGTAGAGGTGVDGFALDPGPGDSAGIRYAHASGKTVTLANSVYPMVIFGPNSVTKAASDFTGPYGETVVSGPFDRLGRFLTFGWYLVAGYARTRNAWLFRGEVGSSQS